MSGATENRWRRGGPQHPSPGQQSPAQQGHQQQRQSGLQSGPGQGRTNTPNNRDGSGRASSAAWGQDRRGGGSGPGSATQSPRVGPSSGTPTGTSGSPAPPKDNAAPPASMDERHVSANGFNAGEVAEYFKGEYQAIISAAGGEKELVYKPVRNETKTAWGVRPNQMANGRDFFMDLTKQIKALEEAQRK